MRRRFIKTSKKAIAIAMAAVMAMPTVMANPIEAEAAATDYMNPAYLYEFEQDLTNSGSSGDATASIVGSGTYVEDAERGWVFNNASGTTAGKGLNYVKLPASFVTDLADETAMTIGMWIKSPNAASGDISGGWAPIFTMTKSTAEWNWFCMGVRGTTHGNFSGNFDNNVANNNTYNGYLDDKEWHYLAATVTATKTVVYIDGEVFNSLDRTDSTKVFSDSYDIVAIGGNQVHCWNDNDSQLYIDDAAIWFEELSAADIKYIATGEKAASITGISAVDTTVNTGETVKVEATYAPADTADFGFTLSSSDESVVTVDGAYLLGVSEGTATVTITSTINTEISNTFKVIVSGSEWGSKTDAVTTIENPVYGANKTPYERLEGDFNITYTFTNTASEAVANRWENFFLNVMDANGNLQHYRCDAWCDSVELGEQNWDGTSIDWGDNFATYMENIKDADVTVNVVRQGASLVVNYTMVYADDSKDTAVCKITLANPTDVLFVRLGSGFSTLTNIKLTSLVETIGAQYNETTGTDLGFVTTISKADFEAVTIKDMGVLVKNNANPTDKAMVLANVGAEIKKIATPYVTELADLDSNSTATDTYAFRSIITGISDEDKEFTAVPYITYVVDDTEYTIYGAELTRTLNDVK